MPNYTVRKKKKKSKFMKLTNIVSILSLIIGILSIIVSGIISNRALNITINSQERLSAKAMKKESLENISTKIYQYGKIFKYDTVAVKMVQHGNVFTYTQYVTNHNKSKDPITPLKEIEAALSSSFLPYEFTRGIETYINEEIENEYCKKAINQCVGEIKDNFPEIYNKAIHKQKKSKADYSAIIKKILKNSESEQAERYKRYLDIKKYVNAYANTDKIIPIESQKQLVGIDGMSFGMGLNFINKVDLAQCTEILSQLNYKKRHSK